MKLFSTKEILWKRTLKFWQFNPNLILLSSVSSCVRFDLFKYNSCYINIILHVLNIFYIISHLKRMWHSLRLNKLESLSTKDTLGKVWPNSPGITENVKGYIEYYDDTTDILLILIGKAHKSLWQRWAKKVSAPHIYLQWQTSSISNWRLFIRHCW